MNNKVSEDKYVVVHKAMNYYGYENITYLSFIIKNVFKRKLFKNNVYKHSTATKFHHPTIDSADIFSDKKKAINLCLSVSASDKEFDSEYWVEQFNINEFGDVVNSEKLYDTYKLSEDKDNERTTNK